ncbi:MAG TPA: RebB family R body protein [Caulobacteraceae bacterium]|jgi:hypothetical protein
MPDPTAEPDPDADTDADAGELAETMTEEELAAAEAAMAAPAMAEDDLTPSDASDADGGDAAGDDTPVNGQTIDSLVAIDAAVGTAAVLGAGLPQVAAQAVGLALLNAVNAQQNAYVTANATVLATVGRILALRAAPPVAPAGDAAGG